MTNQAEPAGKPHDFSSGAVCLDLANTAAERLSTADDLLDWALAGGLIDDERHARLAEVVRTGPRVASALLRRAHELRELVFRLFCGEACGRPRDDCDVARLNRLLARALPHLRLRADDDGGYAWGWDDDDTNPERVLWPVVRSAANLLASDELSCVRECDAASCSWLFVDRSRNRRRRWCDMKVCGNRAKVRRHYHRRVRRE